MLTLGVIMYADHNGAMQAAIDETDERRGISQRYNEEHGIIEAFLSQLEMLLSDPAS